MKSNSREEFLKVKKVKKLDKIRSSLKKMRLSDSNVNLIDTLSKKNESEAGGKRKS